MSKKRNCLDCDYSILYMEYKKREIKECRRFPPQFSNGYLYPKVCEEDWCFEYKNDGEG